MKEDLKLLIEEFKKENGNAINYTPKELIQSLHIKIDKIDSRLAKGDVNFATIQTDIKIHKRAILGLYGLLGLLLVSLLIGIVV